MNAALLWHGEKFRLRGKNAEIALTRLKNAKIDLYNVKKTEKDAVTFEVKGKQARKVFAIYPKTWYNKAERGGYEAISLGETGVFPRLKGLQKRAGLLAGAAAFLLITAFADNFVFDAVYTGDGALCRQARRIVRESGVTAFSRFDDAQAEEISAKMRRYAERVAEVIGLDTYSRSDFLLDENNQIYCLEANTLPGMTPTSLLPQEAAVVGINFNELCEKLIEISLRKYEG